MVETMKEVVVFVDIGVLSGPREKDNLVPEFLDPSGV